MSLLDDDQCRVCFHGPHPGLPCVDISHDPGPPDEDGTVPDIATVCGCLEYVDLEAESRIIVSHEHRWRQYTDHDTGYVFRVDCIDCGKTPWETLMEKAICRGETVVADFTLGFHINKSHQEGDVRVIDDVIITGAAMSPARIEDKTQAEVLLLMRAAIDTAINNPGPETVNHALTLASLYPRAMSGGKMRANLGQARWDWLNEHGVYPSSFGVTEPEYRT